MPRPPPTPPTTHPSVPTTPLQDVVVILLVVVVRLVVEELCTTAALEIVVPAAAVETATVIGDTPVLGDIYAAVVITAGTIEVVIAGTYTAEVVSNVVVAGEPVPACSTRQSVTTWRLKMERYKTFPTPALPLVMLEGQLGMLEVVAEVDAVVMGAMLVIEIEPIPKEVDAPAAMEVDTPTAMEADTPTVTDADTPTATEVSEPTAILLALLPAVVELPTTTQRSKKLPKPRSTAKSELFGP